MKYSLKDYQSEAVAEVLSNLGFASTVWKDHTRRSSFSLTATTGAGKTVMAAAVLEALFIGSEDFDVEPDAGAVVIWFSDDPSLNEQSRHRLLEASDRLNLTDLVVVQNSFQRERLEPGKVYFLNTQKLGRSSLLVRGHDPSDLGVETEGGQVVMPDMRAFTIWDTIRNTIEDPNLTLYLVLDEAHRGMRTSRRNGGGEKPTIVKRLINGAGSVPGIPVVLGVSATVRRFDEAMSEVQGRMKLDNVVVDAGKVQASGLLKDVINLDVPKDSGRFDTVLLRRGAEKLKEVTEAWEAYAAQEGEAARVVPLMVLQVPNAPNHDEIGEAPDVVFRRWPDLPEDCVAHVFGDHKDQTFGRHSVPYVPPERVHESTWIRVLIAKDAISTGWDCPRAEVMVSFRPANDSDYITQLVVRLVRTPLARRIAGDDVLNAVDCLLPFFDENSVEKVAKALMSGGEDGDSPPGRRVLTNPEQMQPNPDVPEEVWEKLVSLKSQSLPKRHARPIKRLITLAHELAQDGLLAEAGKTAHAELHKSLDAAAVQYADEIRQKRRAVVTVQGRTLRTDLGKSEMTFDDFVEEADYAVINDIYGRAGRVFSPGLAKSYTEHLATKGGAGEDREADLMAARTAVAALGLVPEVRAYLDKRAETLARGWVEKFRIKIKSLPEGRQQVYRDIQEMSAEPMDVELMRPKSRLQEANVREADGTVRPLPRFAKHLLCGDDGLFPDDLNGWELEVMKRELERQDVVGWYRNPSRSSQDSLGIAYDDGTGPRIVRPDFIVFARLSDGAIAADIVDPHGIHLGDALPKLRGLARYAEEHGSLFRRIDSIAKTGDHLRVLDPK